MALLPKTYCTFLLASFFLCFLLITAHESESSFKCSSSGVTCNAIVGYTSPNITTLSALKSLFNVKKLESILGYNNLPTDTPINQLIFPNQTLKIPIPCYCVNGTGRSKNGPIYTVFPGDNLRRIAALYGNLVTYDDIQASNGIKDAEAGQRLQIPLPCSCDEVEGQRVLHYALVVAAGSFLGAIARQHKTSQDVVLKLNGLKSPKDLNSGSVLDVPLPTCKSTISNRSLDYPLLVPYGTYVFTADNCIICKCRAATDWNLECKVGSFSGPVKCPLLPRECVFSLVDGLGDPGTICGNYTWCDYAGYTNETMLTVMITKYATCPADGPNNGSGIINAAEVRRSVGLILSNFFYLIFSCLSVVYIFCLVLGALW